MPLYVSGKYKFGNNQSMRPYSKLNLGYAFWWADDQVDIPNDRPSYDDGTNGGFLFGVAAGLQMGMLTLEANYSRFSGAVYGNYKYMGYNYYYNSDVDFNFLSLRVGLAF